MKRDFSASKLIAYVIIFIDYKYRVNYYGIQEKLITLYPPWLNSRKGLLILSTIMKSKL